MRVSARILALLSRDEFIGDSPQRNCAYRGRENFKMLIRKTICSVALILLTAGSFGAPSFAAAPVGQNNTHQLRTGSGKRLRHTALRHQAASARTSKRGQRTIIFVGGKIGSHDAATRSNPTSARKSNGSLNPQPIPPGKQRRP